MADEPFELPPEQSWEPEEGSSDRPERPRRPARSRRRRMRPFRWFVALLLLLATFAAGLFLGRALEEAPKPGGEFVRVRTLQPTTVGPQVTVTVTVEE
ncbi:MAG: hypothetical protein ACR2OD_03760 [Gaiellaceae bacterium]